MDGERPPRARGRACESTHSPAPVPGLRTGGVATLRGPSGSCATAACAAKPEDLGAPADKLASRCASPERQNVHRPPLSHAHLQYGTRHQASYQNRASASRTVRHVATRSVSPRPARLLARFSSATARFNAACNPPYSSRTRTSPARMACSIRASSRRVSSSISDGRGYRAQLSVFRRCRSPVPPCRSPIPEHADHLGEERRSIGALGVGLRV